MKQKPREIIREIDVFGIDKPASLFKSTKNLSDGWFLFISQMALLLAAVIVYNLD